ncbi:MAG: hypothetical protein WCH99_21090 [Verrucomicrobiota bacterium]
MKLGVALRDGEFVGINDVERGKTCLCVCPGCGANLVARKGDVRVPHFAHDGGVERSLCAETAAHRIAKTIIDRERRIWLPPVYVFPFAYRPEVEEQFVEFDEVRLEQRIKDVQPDLVAHLRGRKLFIEIAVTHRTGLDKILKFRKNGVSALEIRIPKADVLSWETLQAAVVDNGRHKIWLCHRKVLDWERACHEDSKLWWRESFGQEMPARDDTNEKWRLSRKFHMWYHESFPWIKKNTGFTKSTPMSCDLNAASLN